MQVACEISRHVEKVLKPFSYSDDSLSEADASSLRQCRAAFGCALCSAPNSAPPATVRSSDVTHLHAHISDSKLLVGLLRKFTLIFHIVTPFPERRALAREKGNTEKRAKLVFEKYHADLANGFEGVLNNFPDFSIGAQNFCLIHLALLTVRP